MMVQAVSRDDGRGVPMDKRIQLRQKSDGSPEDERLAELILAVWDVPEGTFKHKRALHNLIKSVRVIFRPTVEYEPLLYLSQNIGDFIPTGTTIQTSLLAWMAAPSIR
jgi:hypothetical protein